MLQYWVHTLKASALLLLWLLYNLWLIHPLASHLIIIITWMRTNSWSMWSLSFQGLCTLKERIREQWFSTRVIWCPRGHLAMPGDTLNDQFWGEDVSGTWWLEILPNILQGTGQLPWTQNYLIPNVVVVRLRNPVLEQELRSTWMRWMAFQADRTFHQFEDIKLYRLVLLGLQWVNAPPQLSFPLSNSSKQFSTCHGIL